MYGSGRHIIRSVAERGSHVLVWCGCGADGAAQTASAVKHGVSFSGGAGGFEKSKGDCMVFSGYTCTGTANLRVTAYSAECGIFRSVPARI